MGNIYIVIPTGEIHADDRAMFVQDGLEFPEAQGRWPSSRELRAGLEALAGYRVAYRDNTVGGWDAEIRGLVPGDDATIWVKNAPALDDPGPCRFDLHKPEEALALRILEQLSRVCGPFVVVEGSAAAAVVVTPGCDPVALAAGWRLALTT